MIYHSFLSFSSVVKYEKVYQRDQGFPLSVYVEKDISSDKDFKYMNEK